jgi:endogenous inhibitor of DNA gyrase (YacG/DUF329 family)
MAAPTRARCPTCKKSVPVDPAERPKDYPFCSERCRLLDLHKWLTGEYRIPVASGRGEDGAVEDEGPGGEGGEGGEGGAP